MNLKLAIWDMDGTIVDSREVITDAMATAFETCDLEAPGYERVRHVVGLGLGEACRRLAPVDTQPEDLERLVSAYRDAFVAHRTVPGFTEPLYEGAVETLQRLADEGWLMAIATGKSRRGLEAIFEMHPLEHFFDTLHCADDGPGKPNPAMVQAAMDRVGVEPETAVMIGDAVFDMQMAKAAGIEALGVSWGFGTADELIGAGADTVHHDFAALTRQLTAFAARIPQT